MCSICPFSSNSNLLHPNVPTLLISSAKFFFFCKKKYKRFYLSCPSDGWIRISWSNALELHFAAFFYDVISIWWIWPYRRWYCNVKKKYNFFSLFCDVNFFVAGWRDKNSKIVQFVKVALLPQMLHF